MKKYSKSASILPFVLMLIIFTVTGCYNSGIDENGLSFSDVRIRPTENLINFVAHLDGDNEIPPTDTHATGQAIVSINNDETEIRYKLIVANIENITASHLHVAPKGTNGGVVAFLFSNTENQPAGMYNGILAEGTITTENVIGNIEGDLDALIAAIREGNVYVNVHTTMVPSGEIRGQLE